MKGIIRVGDKNTGGGAVLSHNPTVIAEGHPTFKDNGVPVAFHGHRCACGCTLISSLPQAAVS